MKRRKFIRSMGAAGLVSVATSNPVAAVAAAISPEKAGIALTGGYDVIIAGGGPSGCTAAAAAAREGARALLIESTGALGGMGTSGLLNAWCPFTDKEKIIYKGLAEKVFLEAKKGVPHVKYDDWVPINCEQLKRVYDDLVASFGVTVLFFSQVAAVEMKRKDVVDAVIVANKAGLTAYKAKLFIDCTGDGDVAAWAGADFKMGDDEGNVQQGTLCFSLANVDMYQYSMIGSSVHTNNKQSPVHQMLKSAKYPLVKDAHMNDKVVGPSVLTFNAGHVTVNSIDPASLSSAIMTGRKLVKQLHDGMKEFQPSVFGGSYLSATGALMGIRESRRIVCDYTFTLEDWLSRRSFEDSIGRNAYYIDVHKSGATNYPRYEKGESHGIPFGSLVPKGLKNVLVAGRCISTDSYAHGSLRVMPPCLVTGEAVGVAAGQIYRSKNPDVHAVDIKQLQKRLQEMGQSFL
ncbi:MAG: FAD-dependent oxidoreductase [Tannerella sp.]|jgi:hypothetical protein|nr:FAD-dependent oxidoreductase [Tannerella sp.]